MRQRWLLFVAALGLTSSLAYGQTLVYFGTYTDAKSKGIYVSSLDPSGRLTEPDLAAETVNPSFLAVHPSGRFLYAVNEVAELEGEATGSASAFAIEGHSGRLTSLNRTPSMGPGPCYLSLDRTGRHLLVANYDGGSLAVLPVGMDGRLGPATASVQHVDTKRPGAARAHSIDVDAANRFAIAADLGLDRVFVYGFDPTRGVLTANDPPFVALEPGDGPRHVALHPGGRFAYVLNELAMTLTAMRYDPERGALTVTETVSSLPDGVTVATDYSGAEVLVHPGGRFLYASNRGHDTIAVFAVDENAGTLRLLEHVATKGKTPRGFGIDPSGAYLLAANQESDSVVVFRIDAGNGRLTPTGQTVEVGSPVAAAFVAPDR
jgi:6-phosphogluconolactonase